MTDRELSKEFRDQGFLVIEDVVGEDVLEAVRREYAALMERLYGDWYNQGLVRHAPDSLTFWGKIIECCEAGGFDWYQPLDISLPHHDIRDQTPMHFGPAIFDLVTDPGILDVAEQLIGPEITSNPIQHVRFKPPQHLVPRDEVRAHITVTDWHQDMGVTLPEADETTMVTVWLAMTDATVENGCLQVASGKHEEMLPHCTRTQVGIADKFLPSERVLPVPVRAGGIVVFHPFTPHASLPNTSDGFRWSFDLRYNVTGQPTGRSHFPEFVARSRADPASELTDWQEWQRSWESARARLAATDHIPQHRWSNDNPYCA